MGSKARVVLYAQDEQSAAIAAEHAFEELSRLNATLSDYDSSSEAMRLVELEPNQWHDASDDLVTILKLSQEVWARSGGAFDPTVGPITALWRPAFKSGTPPDSTLIQEALNRTGMNQIEIDSEHNRIRFAREGMRLDFGGIGKGFAAQRALEVLRSSGIRSALIDLGGDLALGEPPPGQPGWHVTIDSGLEVLHEVRLANTGVATSGDLYRHIEIEGIRYSHIIDPRTGLGLTRRVAVTVIAGEPWLADALASAVSVLGETESKALLAAYPDATVFIREAE